MKKIYTLVAAALVAVSASAQKFNVTWNGEAVAQGSTITIEAEEDDYFGDGTMVFVEAKSNPGGDKGLFFDNLTSGALNVSIVATALEATLTNYGLQMCCGGNCMRAIAGVINKNFNTDTDVMGGDKKHIPFQYDVDFNEKGNYGTVKTKVEISAGGQTLSFFVNFVYSEDASVNNATTSGYFRTFDGGVSYSFAKNAKRVLSIYSTDGKLLQNNKLSQRGTVHFNSLPAGVYILEVKEKGRKTLSRKVYIY